MRDIVEWLTELGLAKHAPLFVEAEIDFSTLPDIEEDDLKELGLPLGPRKKIWGAIKRLEDMPEALTTTPDESSASVTSSSVTSDAERRHLTVMFVDLVGSTEMATRMDAEDMREGHCQLV